MPRLPRPTPLVRLACSLAVLAALVVGAGQPNVATVQAANPPPGSVPGLGASAAQSSQSPQDPAEVRALWVDAFHDGIKTPAQVDRLLAWAREANFNALFVQVRRRGDAYYNRATEPRSEDEDLEPGFDALQHLLERAHQGPRPLQVHAWLGTLAVWHKRDSPPLDPAHVFNRHGLAASRADSWLQYRDDGEAWAAGSGTDGTYFLDPGHPDAARYTAELYLHVLRSYDVDGIHLDYVRYFEGHGRDRRWGYNPTSVARYNAHHGYPDDHRPSPRDPNWMAWRREQVTALVRRIYLAAKTIKPRAVVSAAVVTWDEGPVGPRGWERSAPASSVFQDWRSWLHEGIVDYVLPMTYYRDSATQAGWFDNWVRWQQANRGPREVVVGVGAYLNAPDDTLAQLRRARQERPLGVALYSYATPSLNAPEVAGSDRAVLERLRELFPNPAPIPALGWLASPLTGAFAVDVPAREGALVALRGPTERTWRTDGTGFAGGLDLPPGRYALTVQAPNVDPTPIEVAVEVGRATSIRYGPGAPMR